MDEDAPLTDVNKDNKEGAANEGEQKEEEDKVLFFFFLFEFVIFVSVCAPVIASNVIFA